MKDTSMLKNSAAGEVTAGVDPPSKATLLHALEKAKELKERCAEGSAEHDLVASIIQSIEDDLALSELSEQFAEVVLREADRVAAAGGPEAVKEFFAAGEQVLKSFAANGTH